MQLVSLTAKRRPRQRHKHFNGSLFPACSPDYFTAFEEVWILLYLQLLAGLSSADGREQATGLQLHAQGWYHLRGDCRAWIRRGSHATWAPRESYLDTRKLGQVHAEATHTRVAKSLSHTKTNMPPPALEPRGMTYKAKYELDVHTVSNNRGKQPGSNQLY